MRQSIRITLLFAVVCLLLAAIGTALCVKELRNAERGRRSLVPGFLRARIARREFAKAASDKDPVSQMVHYTRAALLDAPGEPEAWKKLCEFYSGKQQWREASSICAEAAHLRPTAELDLLAGNAFARVGEFQESAAAYLAADRTDPKNSRAKEGALWALLATQHFKDADPIAKELVEQALNDPDKMDAERAYIALGFIHEKLGHRDKARQAYQYGLPELKNLNCALGSDHEQQPRILCHGILESTGTDEQWCMGEGCYEVKVQAIQAGHPLLD